MDQGDYRSGDRWFGHGSALVIVLNHVGSPAKLEPLFGRITAARVAERQLFGPPDTVGFNEGIAFDAFGNFWGTHVMSDPIFALTP